MANKMSKMCRTCGIEKELVNGFYYNKTHGYYKNECKMCSNIRTKKWKKDNPEYQKQWNKDNTKKTCANSKKWRETNPEKARASMKKWNESNPEKRRTNNKKWDKDNPAKVYASKKKWRINNPSKLREYNRVRRAREQELDENFTSEQEAYIFDQFFHCCFSCGSIEALCVDHHRPLIKGNPLTLLNAVILCNSCNCSKGTKDPEEYYGLIVCEQLDKRLVIIDTKYQTQK